MAAYWLPFFYDLGVICAQKKSNNENYYSFLCG